MKQFIYRTNFNLTNCVTDFEAAYEYLTEDNMTKYLKNSVNFADNIESIVWILTDYDCGYIELKTNCELTSAELDEVSDWVRGQNSDGLGEGFEQQWFAEIYEDVEHENEYYDDELDEYITETTTEEEYIGCASFDWETNGYKFKLVFVKE